MHWHDSIIRHSVTSQVQPLLISSTCAVQVCRASAERQCLAQVWNRVLAGMAGLPASAAEAKQGVSILAAALKVPSPASTPLSRDHNISKMYAATLWSLM